MKLKMPHSLSQFTLISFSQAAAIFSLGKEIDKQMNV